MYLSAVTLCPLTKKTTVMLQCLDHIILRLAYGDIFRDQTSHLVPTQDDLLTLIWFSSPIMADTTSGVSFPSVKNFRIRMV